MASRARWAALLSYWWVSLIGFFLAWSTQRVKRAPLPRDELAAIAALGEAAPWPRAKVRVSASPGAFTGEASREEFLDQLRLALGSDAAEVSFVNDVPASLNVAPCLSEEGFSADACLKGIGAAAARRDALDGPLRIEYDLLVAPTAEPCPALLLNAARGAVLRWRLGGELGTAKALAGAVAVRMKETWFKRVRLVEESPLFDFAPAFVYSFFLVGDCNHRITWDFRGSVLAPFLRRFLERLRLLVDLEIDSQVVQCGRLGGSGSRVTAANLQADFLRRAGDWPGDTVTRGAQWLPPLVRFVAFKPSAPLQLVDEQQQNRSSFAVQGWGAVAVVGDEIVKDPSACGGPAPAACGGGGGGAGAEVLSACQARQAASAWVSSLRSWLTLPLDGPLDAAEAAGGGDAADCPRGGQLRIHAAAPALDGVADWELLAVARAMHGEFLRRAVETLANLIELVDSLPDVVVRAEIGEQVFQAAADIRRSAAAAAAADLPAALAAARRGFALALAAQHDDTIVAQMYFSTEFKYAVYLPISLPILLPVAVAGYRQLFRARDVRRAMRKKADECAEVLDAQ